MVEKSAMSTINKFLFKKNLAKKKDKEYSCRKTSLYSE